jgi:hypothetical protein
VLLAERPDRLAGGWHMERAGAAAPASAAALWLAGWQLEMRRGEGGLAVRGGRQAGWGPSFCVTGRRMNC